MRELSRAALTGILLAAVLLQTACSVWKMEKEPGEEVSYTVVDKDEIPEELKTQIEQEKTKAMMLTYADRGYLYAVRGYGKQKTSGYSIEVRRCYETDRVIYIETDLLGPERTEAITETETYPYVVIKMEYRNRQVVFE